jgi:hypothetical protein
MSREILLRERTAAPSEPKDQGWYFARRKSEDEIRPVLVSYNGHELGIELFGSKYRLYEFAFYGPMPRVVDFTYVEAVFNRIKAREC